MTKLYHRYVEFNDNEGETWSRFVPVPETEEEKNSLQLLQDVISVFDKEQEDFDEELFDEFYFEENSEGGLATYTEEQVSLLCEENFFSKNGYKEAYGISTINPDKLNKVHNFEDAFEILYKLNWTK